jgi:SagB-type dehydrogenase family enzyme
MAAMMGAAMTAGEPQSAIIALPKPETAGNVSVEQALHSRRSLRTYSRAALSLQEAAQLAWAAQGVTSRSGYRTAPSAGALYPLETFLCAGRVEGLQPGVYKYRPERHDLQLLAAGDRRAELAAAALSQAWVRDAPLTLALAAVFARITGRYMQRGIRYAWMEAGHAAQNILLQAVALGLGGVPVGAFDDRAVARILRMASPEEPLYLIPVGRK